MISYSRKTSMLLSSNYLNSYGFLFPKLIAKYQQKILTRNCYICHKYQHDQLKIIKNIFQSNQSLSSPILIQKVYSSSDGVNKNVDSVPNKKEMVSM